MRVFSQAYSLSCSGASHSHQCLLSWGGQAGCWWSWGPASHAEGSFQGGMCVKGGKGGQAVRRNGSLRARLVIASLSGCAVSVVACWESSATAAGQMAAGSRVSPGAPLSM